MQLLKLFILFTLPMTSFAQVLDCKYEDMNGNKGKVTIEVDSNAVKLRINRQTIQSNKCLMTITDSKIKAECDEEKNSIGVVLDLVNNRFEGMLMSERAEIFSEVKC